MSDFKFPALSDKQVSKEPDTDISEKDMLAVQKFIEDGLPGIHVINESKLYQIMDLYLSGSSYWQISNTVNIKRLIIVYLSHKYGWYNAKREYLSEVESQIKARVIDAKLVSQDFLLQLIQMWQRKIGNQAKRFLSGDEANPANQIDLKEASELRKTIELLLTLNDGKSIAPKSPAVGLNLGEGVTIERNGDNKLTITPKETAIGDMLKKYADLRRSEENDAKMTKQHDIKNDKEEK